MSGAVVRDGLEALARRLHGGDRVRQRRINPRIVAGIKAVHRRGDVRHVCSRRWRPVEDKRRADALVVRRKRERLAAAPAESRHKERVIRAWQLHAVVGHRIQIGHHLRRRQAGDRLRNLVHSLVAVGPAACRPPAHRAARRHACHVIRMRSCVGPTRCRLRIHHARPGA